MDLRSNLQSRSLFPYRICYLLRPQGIASTEPDIEVRLAATNALLNALDFVEGNFEKDHERSMIVQVTCEATQCPQDARIRQVRVSRFPLSNFGKPESVYCVGILWLNQAVFK